MPDKENGRELTLPGGLFSGQKQHKQLQAAVRMDEYDADHQFNNSRDPALKYIVIDEVYQTQLFADGWVALSQYKDAPLFWQKHPEDLAEYKWQIQQDKMSAEKRALFVI